MPFVSFSRLFARHVSAWCLGLIVSAAALVAQTPTAADGFDPDVDGVVHAAVVQADGKILIGGQFSTVRGVQRNNLARLQPDGSLDDSFNPNANGTVRAIAVQADNRILIGGDFTTLQPNAAGTTVNRGRIARLNTDGTVDSFNPSISGDLQPQVHALLVLPDGRIVAGGNFGTVGTTTRNNLARFAADGTLDTAFNPNPNALVMALALHVDNKLIIAGGFTSLSPTGGEATTRNRVARLNPNGTVDSEFDPNANNGVTSLAIQRDGKVVLGGYFTTVQPVGDASPANRVHLARLNPNGTLDSEFYPRIDGDVSTIAIQRDGSLIVGGTFASVWGRGTVAASRSFVARFNADGSVDGDFAPTLNAEVRTIALQADGKVVLGGNFTRALPRGASAGVVRNHLARINLDGSLDTSFELDAGGRILASVTQADGKIVIAGTFTNVGGATHNYVARLNADGSVDASYAPDFNGRVYALALQPDGKVIVGGAFTTIGGETRNRIARLNPSGTIDSEFNPNLDGQVGAIALQGDGRIIVGGTFATVQPIGATATTNRANLLRLNANGTLDTSFDPSPNSSISALAVQSDGKILVGGLFSTFTPGFAANTSAATTTRNFFGRLNSDGTLDTAFNPNPNAQVSTIVLQGDGKIIVGGSFTGFAPPGATELTTRNHLARINTDGAIDTAYNPNANGNVLAAAIQSDGKLLIGGTFTTLQPGSETVFTLRKYAARLNPDGTVDGTFNLDINELPGNRVDSVRVQPDGRVFIGGSFASLQPAGTTALINRRNFVRLNSNGTVDTAFDPSAGGSTGAIVNGLALQPDGKVIVVGSFADLGGAKSINIARFLPEGSADSTFSGTLATDGPVNTVVIRPNAAPVVSQIPGFAWLNPNGTPRPAFAPTARLSGQISAIAVQADGSLLLGGAFTDLGNITGGNLVRFRPDGTLDASFNPVPNGAVSAIVIQPDGRIVIAGSFSTVGGVARNRMARIDADGKLDVTYDPNVNAKINAMVIQSDGLVIIGGTFTTLTPNSTATAVTRNYLARLAADGSLDSNYNPSPNFNVNSLALQSDGKLVAGGSFTSVQPNGGVDTFTRNGLARFNTDGTLDQNFNPNTNGAVNAIIPLANGQFVLGGSFTTFQPNATGTVYTRNNLARVNSDGALDLTFDPNANAAVSTLALQADGSVVAGGTFTTLQPAGAPAPVARHGLARINNDGSLDLNFNPDVNGAVVASVARPDGSVLIGGSFTELQLNGSILVGGNFNALGGIPARNLGSLNNDGSVNTTFQPRPDGAVNAMLVFPDGKVVVGGAFTNVAGAARNRLARFNADGTLDAAFNPNVSGPVHSLALQLDGRILVGGAFATIGGQARANLARLNADGTVDAGFNASLPANAAGVPVSSIAVQPDGQILFVGASDPTRPRAAIFRVSPSGALDATFTAAVPTGASVKGLALQADGKVLTSFYLEGIPLGLGRLNRDGTLDTTFNPTLTATSPFAPAGAFAVQADGRIVIGGGFNRVGSVQRVGIARLSATGAATQILGVTANRNAVIFNRAGTTAELSAVTFELSTDRVNWTRLGEGARVANSGADWQLTGLNLPASGVFYIRARGLVPSLAGTSSGMFDLVREFNYTNPLGVGPAVIAQTPAQAASPAIVIDPVSGIAPLGRVSMIFGEGSVEIFAIDPALANTSAKSRLLNLSTRGRVTTENPLLLGFAIVGTESRSVLVRAVGPALQTFGVNDALAATRLQVYDATGTLIASNEGWGGAANLVQASAATGAFPLAPASADSAALLTLAPGLYSLQVVDVRGAGGIALAEIYDAANGDGARLVNVSSRAAAGTGDAALISGFVISGTGNAAERILLRGVGPGLAQFGATAFVSDPTVSLYNSEGRALGANDNWVSSVGDVSTAAARSGAFPLAVGSKDAAVLATLPSGAYTVQVSGPNTGTALLEIYEVR